MTAIIIQLLIGGVLLGGLYALIAFGLSLIYGVARILNFAHGTLLAIAGIAASVMSAAWGLNPLLIAAILLPVVFRLRLAHVCRLARAAEGAQSDADGGRNRPGHRRSAPDPAATLPRSLPVRRNRNIRLDLDVFVFGGIIVSTTELYILLGIVGLTLALHVILSHGLGSAARCAR